jgi:hypothetical protein
MPSSGFIHRLEKGPSARLPHGLTVDSRETGEGTMAVEETQRATFELVPIRGHHGFAQELVVRDRHLKP